MIRFALEKLFGAKSSRSARRLARSRTRLSVERMEDRLVPSTLHVGTAAGDFSTIQAAVNAAHANDTILVAPGTYNGQVTVDNSVNVHDGLKILGSGQGNTFITAPANITGSNAIVEINGTQNVSISNFTIEGPVAGMNQGGDLWGVQVVGGGSAKISNNHITNIEDTPFGGVQEGFGIDVGLSTAAGSGSAVIVHNTIDSYQKGGILVDGAASTANIISNTITGSGPQAIIDQSGIQVSDGAAAQITNNHISGNIYTLQSSGTQAYGILLYQPGAVSISGNRLNNNDVGVSAQNAIGPSISSNTITGSTYSGIQLQQTSYAAIVGNTTNNNGAGDTTNTAGDGGISLTQGSSYNLVIENITNNNTGVGLFADATSIGNLFTLNSGAKNTIFDAEDLSTGTGTDGTNNIWTINSGTTSNPSGLFNY